MEKKLTDEFNPSMKVWVRSRADKEKAMAKQLGLKPVDPNAPAGQQ